MKLKQRLLQKKFDREQQFERDQQMIHKFFATRNSQMLEPTASSPMYQPRRSSRGSLYAKTSMENDSIVATPKIKLEPVLPNE